MSMFADLNPPYSTIVADPPWPYGAGPMTPPDPLHGVNPSGRPLPYSEMTLEVIASLPIREIAADDSRLFLWVTNRYVRQSWDIVEGYGFTPSSRLFVWCKPHRATMTITTEYFLIGKRGTPPRLPWHGTTWFGWPRQRSHSAKPAAFFDLVESWCPGPYVELFARQPRLGWDSWGYGYEAAS